MINKETILLKTNNGLDVFRHFLPGDWRPGKNFLNPFYDDKNASCYIYKDKQTGIFKIKDFGDERYSGDCFALVGLLYGLDCRDDFQEILQVIVHELSLEDKTQNPVFPPDRKTQKRKAEARILKTEEEQNTLIPPVFKAFSKREQAFWESYGIHPPLLSKFNVRAIQSFRAVSREGVPYGYDSHPGEPIFGYCHPRFIKIYRPESKMRFLYLGEKPPGYIFGMKQLPDKGNTLFITGGEKDVMALSARGFPAICFNSESAMIPKETIKTLSVRFRNIILLYDMDSTGLRASEYHARELMEFDVKRMLLPLSGNKESKDIADFFKQGFTAEDLKALAPQCWPPEQRE